MHPHELVGGVVAVGDVRLIAATNERPGDVAGVRDAVPYRVVAVPLVVPLHRQSEQLPGSIVVGGPDHAEGRFGDDAPGGVTTEGGPVCARAGSFLLVRGQPPTLVGVGPVPVAG